MEKEPSQLLLALAGKQLGPILCLPFSPTGANRSSEGAIKQESITGAEELTALLHIVPFCVPIFLGPRKTWEIQP